jgi:hypothetical protein
MVSNSRYIDDYTNKSEGNRRLRMTLGWTDVSIVISKIVNKTDNRLLPQTTEHKNTTTYGVGNPGPGFMCKNS